MFCEGEELRCREDYLGKGLIRATGLKLGEGTAAVDRESHSLSSPEDPTGEAEKGGPEASAEPEGKPSSPGAPLFSCALWPSDLVDLWWALQRGG